MSLLLLVAYFLFFPVIYFLFRRTLCFFNLIKETLTHTTFENFSIIRGFFYKEKSCNITLLGFLIDIDDMEIFEKRHSKKLDCCKGDKVCTIKLTFTQATLF